MGISYSLKPIGVKVSDLYFKFNVRCDDENSIKLHSYMNRAEHSFVQHVYDFNSGFELNFQKNNFLELKKNENIFYFGTSESKLISILTRTTEKNNFYFHDSLLGAIAENDIVLIGNVKKPLKIKKTSTNPSFDELKFTSDIDAFHIQGLFNKNFEENCDVETEDYKMFGVFLAKDFNSFQFNYIVFLNTPRNIENPLKYTISSTFSLELKEEIDQFVKTDFSVFIELTITDLFQLIYNMNENQNKTINLNTLDCSTEYQNVRTRFILNAQIVSKNSLIPINPKPFMNSFGWISLSKHDDSFDSGILIKPENILTRSINNKSNLKEKEPFSHKPFLSKNLTSTYAKLDFNF